MQLDASAAEDVEAFLTERGVYIGVIWSLGWVRRKTFYTMSLQKSCDKYQYMYSSMKCAILLYTCSYCSQILSNEAILLAVMENVSLNPVLGSGYLVNQQPT